MKLLAYAIFAISVLLFAGFARAAIYETSVHISDVSFRAEDKQMTVSGNLPNPCTQLPAASMSQDHADPQVLTVRLSSPLFMDICVQRIQPYVTQIDVPTLVRVSRVQIDPKTVYVLRTEDNAFEMKVLGSELVR